MTAWSPVWAPLERALRVLPADEATAADRATPEPFPSEEEAKQWCREHVELCVGFTLERGEAMRRARTEAKTKAPDKDAEAERLLSGIRRKQQTYLVVLKLAPGPCVQNPESERNVFASLSMDEKDRLEAEYQKLVDGGLLERFRICAEPRFDFDMCVSIGRIVECLAATAKIVPAGEKP